MGPRLQLLRPGKGSQHRRVQNSGRPSQEGVLFAFRFATGVIQETYMSRHCDSQHKIGTFVGMMHNFHPVVGIGLFVGTGQVVSLTN